MWGLSINNDHFNDFMHKKFYIVIINNNYGKIVVSLFERTINREIEGFNKV
jgi:hypothetical protein